MLLFRKKEPSHPLRPSPRQPILKVGKAFNTLCFPRLQAECFCFFPEDQQNVPCSCKIYQWVGDGRTECFLSVPRTSPAISSAELTVVETMSVGLNTLRSLVGRSVALVPQSFCVWREDQCAPAARLSSSRRGCPMLGTVCIIDCLI